jgi:hypothetical protein
MTNNDMTTDETAVLSGLLVALKVILAAAVAAAIVTAEPIQEDDPAWNCHTMGNRVCGPDNATGVTPGCYNDRGVLVAAWPCHVVVDEAGNGNIYTERRTA